MPGFRVHGKALAGVNDGGPGPPSQPIREFHAAGNKRRLHLGRVRERTDVELCSQHLDPAIRDRHGERMLLVPGDIEVCLAFQSDGTFPAFESFGIQERGVGVEPDLGLVRKDDRSHFAACRELDERDAVGEEPASEKEAEGSNGRNPQALENPAVNGAFLILHDGIDTPEQGLRILLFLQGILQDILGKSTNLECHFPVFGSGLDPGFNLFLCRLVQFVPEISGQKRDDILSVHK